LKAAKTAIVLDQLKDMGSNWERIESQRRPPLPPLLHLPLRSNWERIESH